MTKHETFPADPRAALCIILARGGSKGVPRKNLQKIGGLSLVARSVRAARRARRVGRVIVSTDCPEIAEEAGRFGARVVKRPPELSGDGASSESGWLHALTQVNDAPDDLVFLQCTSPFTTGADIDGCLRAMHDDGADCALSVVPDHGFLWTGGANGAAGLTHDAAAPRPRRQEMTPRYRETGAVYTARRAAFQRTGQRFCGRVALHEVPHPPVEIDTPEDLELCRAIAPPPDPPERARLAGIRALVMDFDGVHTDNCAALDDTGREIVHVSRGDGMGLARLQETGHFHCLILSKERNAVVTRRAEKLGIPVWQACDDKRAALTGWCAETGLDPAAVLYVGNDINDAPVLGVAGVFACPCDAHPMILKTADWVLPAPGGRGALRHLCDRLLEAAPCSA